MATKKAQTTSAKKTTRKKTTTSKKNQAISLFEQANLIFNDNRTKLLLAGLFVFFAIFMFLAFVSYMINWTEDQSQFDLQNYSANTNIQVENSSGKMGASIANLFLYEWFGIASFSFIFLLVLFSLHLVKVKVMPLGKATKYALLGTFGLRSRYLFIFGDDYLILGGSHGYHISSWLVSLLGSLGTAFVLLIIFGGFILFTFKVPPIGYGVNLILRDQQPKLLLQNLN
ncbi:MAG: hypothetical protein HC831_22750, partial [Chloroflexia bacterium]|nr:hypothetical protein [Chloroflexia bacterium]